jgi:hypothetical protein
MVSEPWAVVNSFHFALLARSIVPDSVFALWAIREGLCEKLRWE